MYTIACEDRDHPEWHLGTRHAAVWAFEVEWDPAPARRVLGGLLPGYRRQPHITLAYGGLLGTEFDAASHERDVKSLTDLMTPGWSLTIRAIGWGTFTTTPYLAVADPQGWMQQAHEELCRNDPRRRLDHYVPHITLGHHAVRRRLTEVTERLGTLPPRRELAVRICVPAAIRDLHDRRAADLHRSRGCRGLARWTRIPTR